MQRQLLLNRFQNYHSSQVPKTHLNLFPISVFHCFGNMHRQSHPAIRMPDASRTDVRDAYPSWPIVPYWCAGCGETITLAMTQVNTHTTSGALVKAVLRCRSRAAPPLPWPIACPALVCGRNEQGACCPLAKNSQMLLYSRNGVNTRVHFVARTHISNEVVLPSATTRRFLAWREQSVTRGASFVTKTDIHEMST
jgi:hypothetical protein